MKDSIKKAIKKRILPYILIFGGLNQITPAACDMLRYNARAPAVARVDRARDNNLPKNFNTLEYLLYANSLAHRQAQENDQCVELSERTYFAYQKLIRLNNRMDLENSVRFVGGEIKCSQDKAPVRHMWLQYRDNNGKIKDFETTMPMPCVLPSRIMEFSSTAEVGLTCKVKRVELKSGWGSFFKYPTMDHVLYPGGLVRVMYRRITGKIQR